MSLHPNANRTTVLQSKPGPEFQTHIILLDSWFSLEPQRNINNSFHFHHLQAYLRYDYFYM